MYLVAGRPPATNSGLLRRDIKKAINFCYPALFKTFYLCKGGWTRKKYTHTHPKGNVGDQLECINKFISHLQNLRNIKLYIYIPAARNFTEAH
jgi:hypothetical protein